MNVKQAKQLTGSGQLNTGLDRCICTIVAAVMTLRDCGESDNDIVQAINAVMLFGPLEVVRRMEAATRDESVQS